MSEHKSFNASSPPPLRGGGDPMRMPPARPGKLHLLLTIVAGLAVIYGAYFWLVRRVVVERDHVLVLTKKNGARSLPGDQIIIPRPPADRDSDAYRQWEQEPTATATASSSRSPRGHLLRLQPVRLRARGDRHLRHRDRPQRQGRRRRPPVRRAAARRPGARRRDGQRGPLPGVLQPARYNEFANPYAYEMKVVDPVRVDPGHRGVVTVMAGRPARSSNGYLVDVGEQGVQQATEPEGSATSTRSKSASRRSPSSRSTTR